MIHSIKKKMGLFLAVIMFFSSSGNILTYANEMLYSEEPLFISSLETARTTTPSLITITTPSSLTFEVEKPNTFVENNGYCILPQTAMTAIDRFKNEETQGQINADSNAYKLDYTYDKISAAVTLYDSDGTDVLASKSDAVSFYYVNVDSEGRIAKKEKIEFEQSDKKIELVFPNISSEGLDSNSLQYTNGIADCYVYAQYTDTQKGNVYIFDELTLPVTGEDLLAVGKEFKAEYVPEGETNHFRLGITSLEIARIQYEAGVDIYSTIDDEQQRADQLKFLGIHRMDIFPVTTSLAITAQIDIVDSNYELVNYYSESDKKTYELRGRKISLSTKSTSGFLPSEIKFNLPYSGTPAGYVYSADAMKPGSYYARVTTTYGNSKPLISYVPFNVWGAAVASHTTKNTGYFLYGEPYQFTAVVKNAEGEPVTSDIDWFYKYNGDATEYPLASNASNEPMIRLDPDGGLAKDHNNNWYQTINVYCRYADTVSNPVLIKVRPSISSDKSSGLNTEDNTVKVTLKCGSDYFQKGAISLKISGKAEKIKEEAITIDKNINEYNFVIPKGLPKGDLYNIAIFIPNGASTTDYKFASSVDYEVTEPVILKTLFVSSPSKDQTVEPSALVNLQLTGNDSQGSPVTSGIQWFYKTAGGIEKSLSSNGSNNINVDLSTLNLGTATMGKYTVSFYAKYTDPYTQAVAITDPVTVYVTATVPVTISHYISYKSATFYMNVASDIDASIAKETVTKVYLTDSKGGAPVSNIMAITVAGIPKQLSYSVDAGSEFGIWIEANKYSAGTYYVAVEVGEGDNKVIGYAELKMFDTAKEAATLSLERLLQTYEDRGYIGDADTSASAPSTADWPALCMGVLGKDMDNDPRMRIKDGRTYAEFKAENIKYLIDHPTALAPAGNNKDMARNILAVAGAGYNPRDFGPQHLNLVKMLADEMYVADKDGNRQDGETFLKGEIAFRHPLYPLMEYAVLAMEVTSADAADGYTPQKREASMKWLLRTYSNVLNNNQKIGVDYLAMGMPACYFFMSDPVYGAQFRDLLEKYEAKLADNQFANGGFNTNFPGIAASGDPNVTPKENYGANSNSMSVAMMTLMLTPGANLEDAKWQESHGTFLTAVLSCQKENGNFTFGAQANEMANYQALQALIDIVYGPSYVTIHDRLTSSGETSEQKAFKTLQSYIVEGQEKATQVDQYTQETLVALNAALETVIEIKATAQLKEIQEAINIIHTAILGLKEKAATGEPENPSLGNITVEFSLYGVPKHGDKGGSFVWKKNPEKFQSWIPQRAVTIPEGSTVYEAFALALTEAGIRWQETQPNYIGKISMSNGEWLGEFDNGKYSGWMYTVNGRHPLLGLREYTLQDGDHIVWHYTDDYRYEEGSEQWMEENFGSTGESTVEIIATQREDGTAVAGLNGTKLENFLAELEMLIDEKDAVAKIDVDLLEGTKGLTFIIPYEVLEAFENKSETSLEISSGIGSLRLDAKTIRAIIDAASNRDVEVVMNKMDPATLSKENQMLIGAHPIYSLSILIGGQPLSSFKGGKIKVFIPYALAKGEKAENLVIYFADENEKAHKINDVLFDKEAEGLYFTTDHFSIFAIGYIGEAIIPVIEEPLNEAIIRVEFNDVPESHWARESIYYLAERNLIHGVGKGLFAPEKEITRAEFVTLLFKISGDNLPEPGTKFTDVDAAKWYAPYVAWANENRITSGISETTFAPEAQITRQDMAVMIKRYMDSKGLLINTTKQVDIFGDDAQIDGYAKEAVYYMQQVGIIEGIGNNSFNPKKKAKRAEVAKMIAELVKKMET